MLLPHIHEHRTLGANVDRAMCIIFVFRLKNSIAISNFALHICLKYLSYFLCGYRLLNQYLEAF